MKPANCPPREPVKGSEASDHGPLLRNTTNASKFGKRVNQTGADSNAGETIAADGLHITGSPAGPRMVEGSVSAHPQGRRCGRGRSNRGGIRTGSGGQPTATARPREIRHVPRSPRAASAHSEGGLAH